VRSDGRHVLLLAFESADHPLDAWIERAVALALAHGGDCASGPRTRGPADARGARGDDDGRWRQAFFDGPYLQTNLVSLGVLADTFETACTWAAFPELHGALRDALVPAMQRIGGAGVLTCRFTHVYPDGPAPYYTFVTSTRPGAEAEHWLELKSLASDVLLSHGATITHHHAVGRTHRPWYARQVPDLFLRGLRAIKRELDPRGMLNPGVLIPSENS
jgi:alkyldihydroxyacetonephosphate synthase